MLSVGPLTLVPRDVAALADLAGALALPLAAIALSRAVVLRRAASPRAARVPGDDPIASLWLGQLLVTQFALLAMWLSWFGALGAAGHAPLSWYWFRGVPHAALGPALWGVAFAPLLLATTAATSALGELSRKLGVSDRAEADTRSERAWAFALFAVPSFAFVNAIVSATRLQWTLAVGFAVLTVAAAVFCASRWRGSVGYTPHAADEGELREAVFGLAARARVRFRQLYVVPMKRSRMANAFAVQGNVVVLTDLLLERLTRREVNAVLAHEVGHLAGGHPRRLSLVGTLALVPGIVAVLALPSSLVGLGLLLAGWYVSMAHRRHLEFDADRRAVALSGDGEALIAGLVKLASVARLPVRWSRWTGMLLTHPSVESRARALAARGLLASERIAPLLAGEALAGDRYAVPAVVAGDVRAFTTPYRHATLYRNAWLLLFGSTAVATLCAWIVNVAQLGGFARLGALALAALSALAALVLLSGRLAIAAFPRLRSALEARYPGPEGSPRHFVGLAPHAGPRVYEGFYNWDVGVITFEGARLRYRGDGVSFALAADELLAVERVDGPPGWVRTHALLVTWARTDGVRGSFRLTALEAASLFEFDRALGRLESALGEWRASALASHAALLADDGTPGPEAWSVTAAEPHEAVQARAFVSLALLSGFLAVVTCLVVRLPILPWSGAGALDVWLASVAAHVVHVMPSLAWRDRAATRAAAAEAPPDRRAA